MWYTFVSPSCGAEETSGDQRYEVGTDPQGVCQSWEILGLGGMIYDKVGVRQEGAMSERFILPLLERPQVTPVINGPLK